ncbi:MAG TPA: hypothetical protein VGA20_10340 [Gemmatimonadales bacterium]
MRVPRAGWLLLIGLVPAMSNAQAPAKPEPIKDNSFLLEEAYNQEARVVQHISLFLHTRQTDDWAYAFTQEWPLGGPRHQLSYTLTLVRVDAGGSANTGLGDLALNYRHQLVGVNGGPLAVAPRVSLLLPTGDAGAGLGAGTPGVQVNLPVSWQPGRSLVTHWNAGVTLMPRDGTADFNLGQSLIWLTTPTFNAVLETAWASGEGEQLVVAPGLRAAFNFGSLQVVPGIALPIGLGPSAGEHSLAVYLSLEHPFGRR